MEVYSEKPEVRKENLGVRWIQNESCDRTMQSGWLSIVYVVSICSKYSSLKKTYTST